MPDRLPVSLHFRRELPLAVQPLVFTKPIAYSQAGLAGRGMRARSVAVGAAALSVICSPAMAQPVPADASKASASVVVPIGSPLWKSEPTTEDMERFFESLPPPVLAHSPVEVIIECRVGIDGALENCIVAEETRPRSGFGKRALRLMARFRFAAITPDGRPTAGGTVRVPLALLPPQ